MKKVNYKLYCHKNEMNGKCYIGVTSRDRVEDRWDNGRGYSTQVFGRAIQKYGWDNFKHEILLDGLTKDEAFIKEKEYIKLFNSMFPNGYNVSKGGNTTYKKRSIVCIETKETFDNIEEVLEKKEKQFKGKITHDNIKDCCNYEIPYIITPYTKNRLHFQYVTSNVISEISEIEEKCYKKIKERRKRSEKILVPYKNRKSEFDYVTNDDGFYIRNGYKVCRQCGRLFKKKTNKMKKYCQTCERNGIFFD